MTPDWTSLERALAASPRGGAVDVGCGDGYFLARMAALGYGPLYGYDVSAEAIEAAGRRLGDRPEVTLLRKDASRLSEIADASLMLFFSSNALQYFECDVIAEAAARVLRPGGRAILEVARWDFYLMPVHLTNVLYRDRRWRLLSYPRALTRTALFELTGKQMYLGARAPEIGWTPKTIKRFAARSGLDIVQSERTSNPRSYSLIMEKRA